MNVPLLAWLQLTELHRYLKLFCIAFHPRSKLIIIRGKRGIKERGVLRNAVRNIFILAQEMALAMSLGSKKLAEIFLHTYKPHWKLSDHHSLSHGISPETSSKRCAQSFAKTLGW